MRKQERETTTKRAYEIFDQSSYATVSMMDEENKPYAIMVSLIRKGTNLYFHCASRGKKLDCLMLHNEVCVSAVSTMALMPQYLSVDYASCILNGQASIVIDKAEKAMALYDICERYAPSYREGIDEKIERGLASVCIVKIQIMKITGKEIIREKK